MVKILGSLRLAFFLIALLLAMVVVSAVIPQKDIASGRIFDWQGALGDDYAVIDRLGLDRIYYTPAFFAVVALLGLNLIFGNIRRFRIIHASRNGLFRLRYIGSIVFHLSLLVIIAGILLNYLYKYEGVLALTEGQQASDRAAEYFREFKGPLYRDAYENFAVRLDSLRRAADVSAPAGTARITLLPNGETPLSGEISINHPLEWKDIEFHIGQTTGYSPEIHLLDEKDSTVFRAFMRVAVGHEDNRDIHRDFVFIPDQDLRLEVEVVPPEADGEYRFSVAVHDRDMQVYEGVVGLGQAAEFEGAKLILSRIRSWCYIGVIKSPYLGLVFFGFWSGLSGMALVFASRILSTDRKS